MKQVIYSPKLAEEEKKKKEELLKEQEKREEYFSQLRKDSLFKKYVMEEILLKELQANKDLSSNFASLISANPE
ncbi:MAG: hypothetical protein EOL91_12650, partial [Actinobacteria bacterium]|nr:hypothetical protein [Actinomycetota bacterium]